MTWRHDCAHCKYIWDGEKRDVLCPNCGSAIIIATNFDDAEESEDKANNSKNKPDK